MSSPIEIEDENIPTEVEDERQTVDLEEGDTAEEECSLSKNGRKRKSKVWESFVEVEVKDKGKLVQKHECIYCKKQYKYVEGGLTSILQRHIKQCGAAKRAKQMSQGMIKLGSQDSVTGGMCGGGGGGFDPMKNREIMAKMIIAHELPFTFVEYTWFNILMRYHNPLFQKVSRFTIKNECIKVYASEREKLKTIFKNISRISLTIDCWTSNQTIVYMSLTAHYVDTDWKLQKRIISFIDLAPPYSGEVISNAILECVMKWGIQEQIGTITLEYASNNDRAVDILKSTFLERDKLHFDGLFFHVRCCAHILNLVVQDGLKTIEGCLVKIREGVKYLRKSPGRLLKFGETAISLGIQTRRSLYIDVKTRWNSTHRMLESALHYKSAFKCYAKRDLNFLWDLSNEEWISASKVCNFLEVFLEATNIFSGTLYPTANLFLVGIFIVKKEICEAYKSSDAFVRKMSEPMFEKFEKYWEEVGILMTIASILDPRYKMALVEYAFKELYPIYEVDERIKGVTNKLRALYEKYSKNMVAARTAAGTSKTIVAVAAPPKPSKQSRNMEKVNAFLKAKGGSNSTKSELEMYLEEPLFIAEEHGEGQFDVLIWWNQNSSKYSTLSKLAKDVLCIPITTVASESAFSVSGRILDDYRSSLTKDMVEFLICGGDWIRASSKDAILTLQQAAKEEEDLEIRVPMSNGSA